MRTLFFAIFALFALAVPAQAQQGPPPNPCPPQATRCHVEWDEHVRVSRSQYGGQQYGRRGGDYELQYRLALVHFAHDLFFRHGGRGNYNPGPSYQREVVILQQRGQWGQGYGSAPPPQQNYSVQQPLQCQRGEQPTFDGRGMVVACTGYRVSGPQCNDPNFPRLARHPQTGQAICVR